jgi:hypothetical protein
MVNTNGSYDDTPDNLANHIKGGEMSLFAEIAAHVESIERINEAIAAYRGSFSELFAQKVENVVGSPETLNRYLDKERKRQSTLRTIRESVAALEADKKRVYRLLRDITESNPELRNVDIQLASFRIRLTNGVGDDGYIKVNKEK